MKYTNILAKKFNFNRLISGVYIVYSSFDIVWKNVNLTAWTIQILVWGLTSVIVRILLFLGEINSSFDNVHF